MTPPPRLRACSQLPVLICGADPAAAQMRDLLARHGHPVRLAATCGAAEDAVRRVRVALLFDPLPDDLLDCVARLRARSWGLRVILIPKRLDAALEEQAMLRDYLHLTVLGPNAEALHALAHDVLRVALRTDLCVAPSPGPSALAEGA
jgi:hypothetical protein